MSDDALIPATTTTALAVLRDGHRDADGLMVPPPPADPELRVRASGPLRVAVIALGVGAACLFAIGLIPGVPLVPFALAANALLIPAVVLSASFEARWHKRHARATALLDGGDVDGAEMRLRVLARRFGGTRNGAVSLLGVAACRAARGDLDGALAIYGELEASRVLAGSTDGDRVKEGAARVLDQRGDVEEARRWRRSKLK